MTVAMATRAIPPVIPSGTTPNEASSRGSSSSWLLLFFLPSTSGGLTHGFPTGIAADSPVVGPNRNATACKPVAASRSTFTGQSILLLPLAASTA